MDSGADSQPRDNRTLLKHIGAWALSAWIALWIGVGILGPTILGLLVAVAATFAVKALMQKAYDWVKFRNQESLPPLYSSRNPEGDDPE